jgi:toxin-antitoxin system PIN domain toxin
MSGYLLDVNFLIALFDPAHLFHEPAHNWFVENRGETWATCPITINGCVRILSSPAYPTARITVTRAIEMVRILCESKDHQFWTHHLSLADPEIFHPQHIAGHRQITDAYLLALAVHHKAKLVTFDRAIPWKSVVGATARSIVIP